MNKKIITIAILLAILLFLNITSAQSQKQLLPEPGLLLASPFYFFQEIGEEIVTLFTFGDVNKTERHLYLAEKRLAEAQALTEKQAKPELIKKTLKKYQDRLEKVEKYHQKVKAKEPKPELEEKISEKLLNHQEVLLRVLNKAPEQAREGIENAIEKSRQGFEQAVESVSKEKREELQQKAEKLQQRCQDSDQGKDYYQKGTVRGIGGTGMQPLNYQDQCLDNNRLKEFFCSYGNWATEEIYTCPNRCQDGACISITTQPVTTSENSPFGFHPGSYTYIQDLGAKWSREGVYVAWEWVDLNRDGNYNFTEAIAPSKPGNPNSGGKINYDTQWLQVPENIKILANVCPFRQGGDFKNSKEPEIYQNFAEKMAERYDGDDDYGCALSAPDCYKKGDNQYPASEVIESFKKNPIKYWQVCNQLFETCKKDCENNYASSFALAQEKTYKGVKAADGSAYVLIAGDSSKDLYPEVFKKLNGKYIDIIDYHRYGNYNWYNPKQDFDFLKTSLQSSGFDITKLRFWIAETGTHSGDPSQRSGVEKNNFSRQSEKQQAEGLIKAYVSALSYGIEKIFWAWDTVEGFGRDCGFFDYTGLIYDGCDCVNNKYTCGLNIGYDKGKDVKKLSYYTYKKMTETLEGSDWNSIQKIQESNGIYVYKFVKQGKPIWVAWNDNIGNKNITISGMTFSQVKITEAVPKYESGKEVVNYNTAFNTETKTVEASKITLTLKDKPVFFVEEK